LGPCWFNSEFTEVVYLASLEPPSLLRSDSLLEAEKK
jgi:hypothetical protein